MGSRSEVSAGGVVYRGEDDAIEIALAARRTRRGDLAWGLAKGAIEPGETEEQAAVREVLEETGLAVTVSAEARVYSMHNRRARFGKGKADYHALRIVFDGWVGPDAPEPHVVEVDGSTMAAAWVPLESVLSGVTPTTALVVEALRDHEHARHQRVAAYAVVRRADEVLLTRLSGRAHLPGVWTLPGGGIEHGERPAVGLAREVQEECGVPCEVGQLLDVHDVHLVGTAPNGRTQDYHGIHLLYEGAVPEQATPRVVEVDGTTDAVAWVKVADVLEKRVEVLDVVQHALRLTADV